MTPRPNILQKRPGVVTADTPGAALAPWIVGRACARTYQVTDFDARADAHWGLTRGRPRDGAVGGSQLWSEHDGAARLAIVRIFEILEGA